MDLWIDEARMNLLSQVVISVVVVSILSCRQITRMMSHAQKICATYAQRNLRRKSAREEILRPG